MKPFDETWHQYGDLVCEQAALLGVEIDSTSCDQLLAHLILVLRTNESFNLTRITHGTEAVRLHIVDSLVAVPEVISAPSGRLADIGSGAGYPGIPLAIVCHRHTTLFESVGKKATFLTDAVKQLGLSHRIEVASARSEELGESQTGGYAIVTARALSALPSVLELASPMLCLGGHVIAYKGVLSADERSRGMEAAHILGFEHRAERRVFLPIGGEERTVIVFVKTGEPDITLPRRPGLAQRRPLA